MIIIVLDATATAITLILICLISPAFTRNYYDFDLDKTIKQLEHFHYLNNLSNSLNKSYILRNNNVSFRTFTSSAYLPLSSATHSTASMLSKSTTTSSPSPFLLTSYNKFSWPILLLSFFSIIGFFGNLLVCLAIKIDPKLQNATNYYLFSLATVDLLVSVLVIPFAIIKNFYNVWILGNFMCALFIFLDVFLCTTSILLLCVISCERYIGIKEPLKNREKSKTKITYKIILIWILSILLSCPILILSYNNVKNIIRDGNCSVYNNHFIIYGSIFSFIIPLTIMIILYCLTVKRLNKVVQEFKLKDKRNHMHLSSLKNEEPNNEAPQFRRCHAIKRKVTSTTQLNNTKLDLTNNNSTKNTDLINCKKSPKSMFVPIAKKKLILVNLNKLNAQTKSDKENITSLINTNLLNNLPTNKTDSTTDSINITTIIKQDTKINNNSDRILANFKINGSNNNISNNNNNNNSRFNHSFKFGRSFKNFSSTKPNDVVVTSDASINECDNKETIYEENNNNNPPISRTSSNKVNKVEVGKFKSIVNKHRLVNRAIYAFQINRESRAVKNEQKAVKVLGFVFVIFVIAWAPFAILNILTAICTSCNVNPSILNILTWLGYISSTINPLVYNAFNEKFRYAFKKILLCQSGSLKKRNFRRQPNILVKLAAQEKKAHFNRQNPI